MKIPVEWGFSARASEVKQNSIMFCDASYGSPLLLLPNGVPSFRDFIGVHLGERYNFEILARDSAEQISGFVVPEIAFRVDPQSVVDLSFSSESVGLLYTSGGILGIQAKNSFSSVPRPIFLQIATDLEVNSDVDKYEKSGFSRWSIVRKEGDREISLWSYGSADEQIP